MLVVFLGLGHACELPVFADEVSHAAEDFHHSSDGHADEHLMSCDGVGVAPSTSYIHVGPPYLDVEQALSVATTVPVRLIISWRESSARLPSRPPLFLLHASLLI